MTETDLQLGGGYAYQWECAILIALNHLGEPVRYNPAFDDLITSFLGQVEQIHLEGEDQERGVVLEDVNLYGGGRRILIQVKTKQAEGDRWTPTDPLLLKALYRFYDSPYMLEEADNTRFVFLTNRGFNPDLVELKVAIQNGTLVESPEAQALYRRMLRYAQQAGKDLPDEAQFRRMLARTVLVVYLGIEEVKPNIQAKLQSYGRDDWQEAHAVLYEHFSRQSTQIGGGVITAVSLEEVLGRRTRRESVLQNLLNRLDKRMLVMLAVLVILIIGGSSSLYVLLRPDPLPPMAGDFRVAVAGFGQQASIGRPEIGMELASSIYLRLQETFDELDLGFVVSIREPKLVGTVKGDDPQERAEWAAELADQINAHVVVYGFIEMIDGREQVVPEFYVSPASFKDAEEIVGAQALGESFDLPKGDEPAEWLKASSEGDARVQALMRVVIGLSHYSLGQYEEALSILQPAKEIAAWRDEQGKEVLYLLTGNIAGRIASAKLSEAGHLEVIVRDDVIATSEVTLTEAEDDYLFALELDPEYARAYVGLGSVYYLRALFPFARTLDYADVDTADLDLAIATYNKAQTAQHQPAGTNIAAKVHYGLGKTYLMKALAVGLPPSVVYDSAIAEFELVIEAYGNGSEPLLVQHAAESYASLGLISRLRGDFADAIAQYERAIAISQIQDRRNTWAQRLEDLKNLQVETPNDLEIDP